MKETQRRFVSDTERKRSLKTVLTDGGGGGGGDDDE